MFYGIISAILASINTLFYKNACMISESIGFSEAQLYWGMNFMVIVLIIPVMVVSGHLEWVDFGAMVSSWQVFGTLTLVALLWLVTELMGQFIFIREKVSVFLPYMETGNFFTVLLAYLILGEHVSSLTFWVAIVASVVLILASVDFRHLTFNRYCALQLLECFIDSFATILVAHVLLSINSLTMITFNQMMNSTLVMLFLLVRGQFFSMFTRVGAPRMAGWMAFNDSIWLVKYLLVLVIMRESGVIITALLSMLQMVVTLVLSYVFLHEKPSRKDIALALFIGACVGIGSFS